MTVRGAVKLARQLNRIPLEARSGIGAALLTSAMKLDSYAKQKIQGGGRGGRTYRRRTVTHQASAPGEFPKTDTGQLVSSLFFRTAANKLSAFFGSKLAYARYLEFGTSRMQARPWLRPTLKENQKEIVERVRRAVQEALRRTARG